MIGLIIVGFIVAILFMVVGFLLCKENRKIKVASYVTLFLGSFFLGVFAEVSPYVLKTGFPVTKIAPGTYKIGFVYKAGSNVSIGVEMATDKEGKEEGLFLYQFPAVDFEGEVKAGAKKLIAYKLTTSDGTFNRYKLE